ncbi:MAG: hypothetical protein RBG13Loki_3235 [Promethearchaeota archaeon CR_4]|nr:MAG: hypothetical protein RBG13Loki_3235 [Candidatus Lokiarchaeota archaeon CR_4]
MESYDSIQEEKPKKTIEEKSAETASTQIKGGSLQHPRNHIPNVFEHQYADYILGLKPPYTGIGSPVKLIQADEGQKRKKQINND